MAVDAQGADRARPYVERAGVTFTTVVDEENLLGRLYGFKAVPNGFLIDERGTVQYKELASFEVWNADTKAVVENWATGGSLDGTNGQESTDLGPNHSQSNTFYQKGLDLYRAGKLDEAMAEWRKGVKLDPDNYIIRVQMMSVEHPERFYAGDVDNEWEEEQLSKPV